MSDMIWNIIGGMIMGFLIVLIGVNIVVECEDWSQPQCVTPWQLLGFDK